MRRAVVLLVALPGLVACAPPPRTPALGCDLPVETDLGYLTDGRWAWFATSGGRAEFSVTDPYDGAVLAIPDNRTIYVGDARTVPRAARSPEDGTIVNAVASVEVDPEHPGTVDLAAGSYWVASHSAPTTMATCPGTTVSGVVPAVGTVATSTPSPGPTSD